MDAFLGLEQNGSAGSAFYTALRNDNLCSAEIEVQLRLLRKAGPEAKNNSFSGINAQAE